MPPLREQPEVLAARAGAAVGEDRGGEIGERRVEVGHVLGKDAAGDHRHEGEGEAQPLGFGADRGDGGSVPDPRRPAGCT